MNLLIPYTKLPDHKDPLFGEFTYGDINKRGGTLKTLRPGDRIFFHAAVKGKQCITAYYIVRQVMETERVVETSELIQKYKSPHIARWQAGTRADNDMIVFGDPLLSKVLKTPLLFKKELAASLSLKIRFPPGRSESGSVGLATRAWRQLTEGDVQVLLDAIRRSSECSDDPVPTSAK